MSPLSWEGAGFKVRAPEHSGFSQAGIPEVWAQGGEKAGLGPASVWANGNGWHFPDQTGDFLPHLGVLGWEALQSHDPSAESTPNPGLSFPFCSVGVGLTH